MTHIAKLPEQEAAIRQLAYELWEKEGRPHGRDKAHWEQATRLVEIRMMAVAKPAEQMADVTKRHGERARSHVHA